MTIPEHFKKILSENQILIVLLALMAGLIFPSFFQPLNRFSTHLLILVFFTSSLRLSLHETMEYAKDWRLLLISTVFMLVVMPLALYYPFSFISREWAIALLIIGAMPTGVTIALIADFFGGKTVLALLITTATSLLAPLTIPLIFALTVGQSVPIPLLPMFLSLVMTIILPFVLAMLTKRAAPKFMTRHDNAWRLISVIAFGLLIAGIVADTAGDTILSFSPRDAAILTLVILWLGVLTWLSYKLVWWRAVNERITVALCMVYLNNTLALFIGNRFFSHQGVMPKLLLLLLMVNVLLPPIKWAAAHLNNATHPINTNPFT